MRKELNLDKVELLAIGKCWGLAELQRQAGLAKMTLYKIRKGENKASAQTIGKLARALEVDPMELLKA